MKTLNHSPSFVIVGCGAVSPAGWGVEPLREALAKGQPLAARELARPGWPRPLHVRQVPAPVPRPSFLSHPRLRRASPITHYATAASLEALGPDLALAQSQALRLGIVLAVLSGCVNYSRRFYDETLKDPSTASPLVFPETVFNAPASHLAAVIGTTAINYTLVGGSGAFLSGVALAADWLRTGGVDACLVIGAEESDWLTADAFRLFDRRAIVSDGAGALYLKCAAEEEPRVHLGAITDSHPFVRDCGRAAAIRAMRAELPPFCPGHLLCDSSQLLPKLDAAELAAWRDWPGERLSPKTILGEGLAASGAWQCVAAIDALARGRYTAANVSIAGCNQQAIGAHFVRR